MSEAHQSINPTPLQFHPTFSKKQPGSCILQADDDKKLCFYFRLSHLAGLSTFFQDLPPPSPDDLVNGVPLIPLPETTSETLFIVLAAIQSLQEPQPFSLVMIILRINDGMLPLTEVTGGDILDAAAFGKRFDLPVIYRLLLEGAVHQYYFSESKAFAVWAIWAIAGVEWLIEAEASKTIDKDITDIPKSLLAAILRHIPEDWNTLQNLHLRRLNALKRLPTQLPFLSVRPGCSTCVGHRGDQEERITILLLRAKTIDEVDEVFSVAHDDGRDCTRCAHMVYEDIGGLMNWFKDFTREYNFGEKTIADYGMRLSDL